MKVLVTGGAGYIGSHAVQALQRAGHTPVVLDNLSRGHRRAVAPGIEFHQLDLRDTGGVERLLGASGIDAVMHFAALAYVGESVQEPLAYYDNNTGGTISLLRAMRAAGVRRIVFSSTCATYGEPARVPIAEDTPQCPVNPYGWSKLFCERALADFGASDPSFGYAALRYFNVCGSASDGSLGEHHEPETHLIPVALLVAAGQRDRLIVHGDDYSTPDGTCIRDYVFVEDLAEAHVHVLTRLQAGSAYRLNLGIGRGYSVREIIAGVERVTGRRLPVETGPRRPGDPPVLYADPTRIQQELGWTPRVTEIEAMIATAWRWFQQHPRGYSE